jgi:hypothetical protein
MKNRIKFIGIEFIVRPVMRWYYSLGLNRKASIFCDMILNLHSMELNSYSDTIFLTII